MRRLTCGPVLLLMVCVAIGNSQNCTEPEFCLAEECVSTSDKLMRWLNWNVKPCDNFYEFACGGWKNSHFLEPGSNRLDAVDTSSHLAVIRNALAEQPKPKDYDALKKAKKLYTSCINHRHADYDSIMSIISDTFGAWPLLCEICYFDEPYDVLITMINKAMYLGVHPFFSLKVGYYGIDYNEGTQRETSRLYIDKPDLLWSVDTDEAFMEENNYIDIYANKIFALSKKLRNANDTYSKEEAFKIASMEYTLAQIYNSNDKPDVIGQPLQQPQKQPLKITVGTLHREYRKLLSWKDLLALFAKLSPSQMFYEGNKKVVYVLNPEGLKKADKYLSTFSKRTLASFIIWRVIQTLHSVLIREDLKLSDVVTESLADTNTQQIQADRCAAYVSKKFHLVAHKLLHDAYRTTERFNKVAAIAKRLLRTALPTIFKSGDGWWREEKINPDWNTQITDLRTTFLHIHESAFLKDFYRNVAINESNFIKNVAVLNQAEFLRELENLNLLNGLDDTQQPQIDPDRINNTVLVFKYPLRIGNDPLFGDPQPPHEFQPKYDYIRHEIVYTATAFKPPLVTGNVPTAVDYAGVGFSIAREMIYAVFYLANRKFNDMRYYDWLKETNTLGTYLQRLDCIFNQYKMDFYGKTKRKEEVWTEVYANMADTAGIRLDYLGWHQFLKREPAMPNAVKPLPNVPFSYEQVFFIQFAQNFCALEEKIASKNSKSKFGPSEIRVLGSLRNSIEFSQAFNCSVGSYMNPQAKCTLW